MSWCRLWGHLLLSLNRPTCLPLAAMQFSSIHFNFYSACYANDCSPCLSESDTLVDFSCSKRLHIALFLAHRLLAPSFSSFCQCSNCRGEGEVEPPSSFERPSNSGKFQSPRRGGGRCNPLALITSLSMNGLLLSHVHRQPPCIASHVIHVYGHLDIFWLMVIKNKDKF